MPPRRTSPGGPRPTRSCGTPPWWSGDEVGVVVRNGEKHPVTSPFTGELLGLLAASGERVRAYQPVAWLTTADDR